MLTETEGDRKGSYQYTQMAARNSEEMDVYRKAQKADIQSRKKALLDSNAADIYHNPGIMVLLQCARSYCYSYAHQNQCISANYCCLAGMGRKPAGGCGSVCKSGEITFRASTFDPRYDFFELAGYSEMAGVGLGSVYQEDKTRDGWRPWSTHTQYIALAVHLHSGATEEGFPKASRNEIVLAVTAEDSDGFLYSGCCSQTSKGFGAKSRGTGDETLCTSVASNCNGAGTRCTG